MHSRLRPQRVAYILLMLLMSDLTGTYAGLEPNPAAIKAKARAEALELVGNVKAKGLPEVATQRVIDSTANSLEAYYAQQEAMAYCNSNPRCNSAPRSAGSWWDLILPSDPSNQYNNVTFTRKNYKTIASNVLYFYDAQRSGKITDNIVPWRESDHLDDTVVGGLFDSGDYLKCPFVLAPAWTTFAWSLIEYKAAYKNMSTYDESLRVLKRATNYLNKSLNRSGEYYIGQIGNVQIDHEYWGRASEQISSKRPAFKYEKTYNASDLFAGVSAALASSAIVFNKTDAKYADNLLKNAIVLYKWAVASEGRYSNYYVQNTKTIYPSTDYLDNLAWAAVWLYKATKNTNYLKQAHSYWLRGEAAGETNVYPNWDGQWAGVAALMANIESSGKVDLSRIIPGQNYAGWLNDVFFRAWLVGDGFQQIRYTPKGMAYPVWSEWGNLAMSTNAAFVALVRANKVTVNKQRNKLIHFSKQQVHYAMGSAGVRSYIIGFGNNYPKYAHHPGASCPNEPATCGWSQYSSPLPNPQILYGAMVGGPGGIRVNPVDADDSYTDSRSNIAQNEVSINYNSGLLGALAGLYYLGM